NPQGDLLPAPSDPGQGTMSPYRPPDPQAPPWTRPPAVLKRLVIWAFFLAIVYLISSFFFFAFMTFMFSYLTLTAVGAGMRRLSPHRERGWLRRLLVIAFFILTPLLSLAVGVFIATRLVAEGRHLVGWISQVDPEAEVARMLEKFVGPNEFKKEFGGPEDPR